MTFDEVHKSIPYVYEGKLHSITQQIYPNVRIKYPGKHAMDTDPVGGDYVVEVLCSAAGWNWKQFTHGDIFKDVEDKALFDPPFMQNRGIVELTKVISGEAIPRHHSWAIVKLPGLNYQTLLQASQVLAVAEHRRYHKYEKGGGGRFLPLRFAIGIVHGNWTAQEAIEVQRRGIHGLRELSKRGGNPPTVNGLLKAARKQDNS